MVEVMHLSRVPKVGEHEGNPSAKVGSAPPSNEPAERTHLPPPLLNSARQTQLTDCKISPTPGPPAIHKGCRLYFHNDSEYDTCCMGCFAAGKFYVEGILYCDCANTVFVRLLVDFCGGSLCHGSIPCLICKIDQRDL